MIPPLPPIPGTPMDAAEYRFWKELERLRKVAGIESPWYTPACRRRYAQSERHHRGALFTESGALAADAGIAEICASSRGESPAIS
jgi:hypothetical protein